MDASEIAPAAAPRERAALRGAGGVLRPGARSAPQVQQRLVAGGRRRPRRKPKPRALEATCERAGLADGQAILELGCGWGSLTLWMAERYPAQPHHARCPIRTRSAPGSSARPRAAGCATSTCHRRHERLRDRAALRPRRVGRDVRAHAQLARAASRACTTGCARAGASSCTSSAIARRPTRSWTPAHPTG